MYVHGAAALLTPDDVKRAESMFKTAKILVALHECSKPILLEALRMARKYKGQWNRLEKFYLQLVGDVAFWAVSALD